MVVKKKKGFMVTLPALPWLIIIVFAIIVVVALLAIIKTVALISSDTNRVSSNALRTMLDSNECTPVTKLPLKDVLAIGIGEGKTSGFLGGDTVQIDYGGKNESVKPVICIEKLLTQLNIEDHDFYVEYPALCPPSFASPGCYGSSPITAGGTFTVESSEYIALPNGDTARVVLKTKG